MNTRNALIMVLAAATLIGCRRPDPTVDLMEAELRWMEDQLYMLENKYQQKCDQLASCRRQGQSLRKDDGSGSLSPTVPAAPPAPAKDEGEPASDLAPPTIEEGQEMDPNVDLPHPAHLPSDINIRPASNEELVDGPSVRPVDARVTHIVLNGRLTGGLDLDGRPGDEGLMLVIEPRNADGQYVSLPGKVAVAVLDPSKTGDDARVARWDFDAVETSRLVRKSLFGRGIHLEMPWPGEPPESTRLRVYVRYTTVDGRRLEADREIQVDPIGPETGGWTPAANAAAQVVPPVQPVAERQTGSDRTADAARLAVPAGGDSATLPPMAPAPDSISTAATETPTIGPPTADPVGSGLRAKSPRRPRKATARRPVWRPYR